MLPKEKHLEESIENHLVSIDTNKVIHKNLILKIAYS